MRLKSCIVLVGLPLSGITTAAQLIAPLLRLQRINVQQLLQGMDPDEIEIDHPLLDYALLGTNPGVSSAVIQLVKYHLKKSWYDGAVLDGIPGSVHEAILLDDYLRRRGDFILRVVYFKFPPEDESLLAQRAKYRLACLECGWVYGKHAGVHPLQEGLCNWCNKELSLDPEMSFAAAQAKIKWSRSKLDSVLDYYQQRKIVSVWDIRAAHSPLQIAYHLAKYCAPPIYQLSSIRPPLLGPIEMLPVQLELPLA